MAEKKEAKSEKKPRPHVDKDKCIGCGTCAQVCPMGVFEIKDKKSLVKKPEECINCKACEMQCPVEAIKVE